MKLLPHVCLAALLLGFGTSGCAAAQPRGSHPMLIDKIPTNFRDTQVLLTDTQYKEEQEPMMRAVEKILQGKYRIIAKHIYLLPPPPTGPLPNPVIFKMDFDNVMDGMDHQSEQVFANETSDWPYLQIWKTSGSHPEYVALALYSNDYTHDPNTFLGYFELEPLK